MSADVVKNVICSSPAIGSLLAGMLKYEGIDSTVVEDVDEATAALGAADLLMLDTVVPALSAEGRAALMAHLRGGGGIVALPGALLSFPDWEDWDRVVGVGSRAPHPGPGEASPVKVSVRTGEHIITAGLGGFEVVASPYLLEGNGPGSEVLATVAGADGDVPVLWAREVEGGRIVCDALGHDERSLSHPAHRIMLCRAARWVLSMSFEREWEEPEEPDEAEEEP